MADIEACVRHGPVLASPSDALARALLDRPHPAWVRSEFDPGHFTASGFVLSPDATALLLVEHRRLGRWLQPGGHFEPDDATVDDAVRREVAEETGVTDLELLDERLLRIDAHAIPPRRDEPAHTHFDLARAYAARRWELGPIDEVLDARWVGLDELAQMGVDMAVTEGAGALRSLAT